MFTMEVNMVPDILLKTGTASFTLTLALSHQGKGKITKHLIDYNCVKEDSSVLVLLDCHDNKTTYFLNSGVSSG